MKKSWDAIILLDEENKNKSNLNDSKDPRIKVAINLVLEKAQDKHNFPLIVFNKWTTPPALKQAFFDHRIMEPPKILQSEATDLISRIYFIKLTLTINRWTKINIVTSSLHADRVNYLCQKIIGSNFTDIIDFTYAKNGLPLPELAEQVRKEDFLLEQVKQEFKDFEDGDHEKIKNFLAAKNHPDFISKKSNSWNSRPSSVERKNLPETSDHNEDSNYQAKL